MAEDNKFSLVPRNGTTPVVQGTAYYAMVDTITPGASYKDGKVVYNADIQKKAEQQKRLYSAKMGSSLAGIQHIIPELKQNDIKILYTTPIAGGDDVAYHRYSTKNNNQIPADLGTLQNFRDTIQELYKSGIKYVFDATYTSEGLEGIHLQRAIRWGSKDIQAKNWFYLDDKVQFAVVPENDKNLRHKVVNPMVIYDEASGKIVENKEYNPNRETYFQVYDDSLVSEEQRKDLKTLIRTYEKTDTKGKELDKITYQDTIISYKFEIDPKEHAERLKDCIENKINPNTSEGTIYVGNYSNFRIGKDISGSVNWDDMRDMIKRNHTVTSKYAEKKLHAVTDLEKRSEIRKAIQTCAYENTDMDLQSIEYWLKTVNNVQLLYNAQVLKNIKTQDEISALIEQGVLPSEAFLTQEQIDNVTEGFYQLDKKGILPREDRTVEVLSSIPLDSFMLGENTLGLLSSSYFSHRATTENLLGKSRFELMQEKNPHLSQQYAKTYNQMDNLYKQELKIFADKIIQKLNQTSKEPLLDNKGDYTEYGEYVIELFAQDIMDYALLTSLTKNGELVKKYLDGVGTQKEVEGYANSIKERTTLKALGVNGVMPQDEAEQFAKILSKRLRNLDDKDVEYLSEKISGKIKGTTTLDFRLAEAMMKKAGLGMDIRIDAAKDVVEIDDIRNGDISFDDAWDNLIDYYKHFVQKVKSVNPHSNITAELTDVDSVMKKIYGERANVYDSDFKFGNKYKNAQDAISKFYTETGITTEAGYDVYSNLLRAFARDFEKGNFQYGDFMGLLTRMLDTTNLDYVRNRLNFVANHDKARPVHDMALDMGIFYGSFYENVPDVYNAEEMRRFAIQFLTNKDSFEDVPQNIREMVNDIGQDGRPDRFRNVSPKAVAMAKLLRDTTNENLKGVISDNEMALLKQSITDLMNGNQLGKGHNYNFGYENAPITETQYVSRAKDGFATMDFRLLIDMLLEQAKYNNGGIQLANEDKIKEILFQKITEPAEQKVLMMMSIISALTGIPALYSGDEYVMSGHETKSKNIYNPRNVRAVETSKNSAYVQEVYKVMSEVMRSNAASKNPALRTGTPKIQQTGASIYTGFYQNAQGDMAVSWINQPQAKECLPHVHEIGEIVLPDHVSLKDGTEFINTNSEDKQTYISYTRSDGKCAIKRRDGDIIIDSDTTIAGLGVALVLKVAKQLKHI